MGNGCCKQEVENNPDGTPKEPQTEEQTKGDPSELRRWAKDGDAAELERLLKRMPIKAIRSGAKKSEGIPEDDGHTALHFAASRGSLPCCELLVLYGAAVNCRGAKGATPLHAALEAGRRQVAHFLLEHGADVNAPDASGASPFLAVLLSGRKRLAGWLLGRCGDSLDVAATDREGQGPVTVAARHGWWELAEQLAGRAADTATVLNTRSSGGETALGWALKYGSAGLLAGPELVRVVAGLLGRGASAVLPLFKEQIPPLCLAAATGDADVVAALRSRGAELEPGVCRDAVGRTALHYAAAKGHESLCALLQSEGGPALRCASALTDAGGNSPLHLAAARGHGGVARALLERSEQPVQEILTPNREGVTVYHLFLRSGPEVSSQEGVLWMLQRLSAEEAATPIKGPKEAVVATPLLLAVTSHQDRVVAALLEAGHDPNQASSEGDTPLSRCLGGATAATAAADGAIFRQLVERGAELESASASCHPLLAICQNPLSRFSEAVVALLAERAGGEPGGAIPWGAHADPAGRGPLHLAALHDNAFLVRHLLEEGKMDVEARSAEGLTPLMYAAWGCSTHAMRILLNRRADPRVIDPSGASALSYCLRLDRPESLACGAMLVVMGAPPDDCVDGRGEGLLHRAVRYGCSEFIRLWARYGGNLGLLATTADAADDLAEELPRGLGAGGGGVAGLRDGDFLDSKPVPVEAEEEAEDGAWELASGRLDGPAAAAVAAVKPLSDIEEGSPYGGDADEGAAAAAADAAQGVPDDMKASALAPAASLRRAAPAAEAIGSSSVAPANPVVVGAPRTISSRVSGSGGAAASGNGGTALPYNASAASSGPLARVRAAEPSALEPTLESFSVPAESSSYGNGGGAAVVRPSYGPVGSVRARAVAEAVEAVEAEAARYPSFCRRPSVLEVRRWVRRGAAWFDDALPPAPDPELGPDWAPPSLPLPPCEEDEAAEEEAVAAEEAPELPPALDPDAILRRMLLSTMRDRRRERQQQQLLQQQSVGAVAAMAAAAGGCGGGVGGRTGSFLQRALSRRGSASGVKVGAGVESQGLGRGGGSRTVRTVSDTGVNAESFSLSAAAEPAAAAAGGGEGVEDWLAKVERSVESVMAALTRGASATSGAAGGSGSRAVRAAMRERQRSQSPPSSGDGAGAATAAAAAAVGTETMPVHKAARRAAARAGPVAEAREDGGGSSSSSSSDDSDNEGYGGGGGGGGNVATQEGKMESTLEDLKDAGIGLASSLLDKKVAINDPYYQRGTRYKGVPRYMDEGLVDVQPAPVSELLALADTLAGRLRGYPAAAAAGDEPLLRGADLRERNIKWYNLGLSPSEYPMKPGQWKAAHRKAKAAAAAARLRASVGAAGGGKVVVRARKVWFGLPAMPSRPELRSTSALVYAVRLARPACVAALLGASLAPLNTPDGWGHTPVAYAAYMLAREDKYDNRLQQVYDLLLERLPQVNFTRLDSEDGSAGHSLLCPVNLAVIAGDRARLAHLVLRCGGAVNCSWTALPDIPTYLNGTWEKAVARCDSRCPPLALAVLSKKLETVKLVLDLGANPNVFGEARDVRLKARLLKEYQEEQERARRLADEYEGLLSKARLGLVQRLARLKRAIAAIEIPGLTRPHPFVTPLHLAARTGQPQAAFLLLRRGALSNGAGSVPYARKSPLQEALMYARSNYTVTNPAARRKNWKEVRPSFEDLPPMSEQAAKKEADQRSSAIMRAMVDPTMMALKAVALAAKYAVSFLLEMRKRPIAHWDPALATAHVLLSYRAPYDLADAQTAIVLRDLMDNGKWKWLRRPGGPKFKVVNPDWTSAAVAGIESLKQDPDIGYRAIRSTPEPKEYRQLKQQFVARADEAYFGAGSTALHERYRACSDAYLAVQQQYVYDVVQPAVLNMAVQAVSSHAAGVAALLETTAAARRAALEGSAAALEGGVALSEEGVMDPQPFESFSPPPTEPEPAPAPGGPTGRGPAGLGAQAAAAAALRALAGRAAEDESWGRVMRWAPGGVYLGPPGEGELEALPSGEEELTRLGRELAGVDTDELKESLENLKEHMGVAVEWMLSKMQDAQEGLSNLLEVIGIDILDAL